MQRDVSARKSLVHSYIMTIPICNICALSLPALHIKNFIDMHTQVMNVSPLTSRSVALISNNMLATIRYYGKWQANLLN